MEYKILRFEKELTVIDGRTVPVYVALVKKEDQEQPFRVVIENFDSVQEALNEIGRWIEVQTKDAEAGRMEKGRIEQELQRDRVLTELNMDIETPDEKKTEPVNE